MIKWSKFRSDSSWHDNEAFFDKRKHTDWIEEFKAAKRSGVRFDISRASMYDPLIKMMKWLNEQKIVSYSFE